MKVRADSGSDLRTNCCVTSWRTFSLLFEAQLVGSSLFLLWNRGHVSVMSHIPSFYYLLRFASGWFALLKAINSKSCQGLVLLLYILTVSQWVYTRNHWVQHLLQLTYLFSFTAELRPEALIKTINCPFTHISEAQSYWTIDWSTVSRPGEAFSDPGKLSKWNIWSWTCIW